MSSKVLLTTIPSDAHSWNLIYIQHILEENGFNVVNLGTCVSYELLLQSCRKEKPDIILVSTINGHGLIEGFDLIKKIGGVKSFQHIPIFIGGKLSTESELSLQDKARLEAAGFTKVYNNHQDINELLTDLKRFN